MTHKGPITTTAQAFVGHDVNKEKKNSFDSSKKKKMSTETKRARVYRQRPLPATVLLSKICSYLDRVDHGAFAGTCVDLRAAAAKRESWHGPCTLRWINNPRDGYADEVQAAFDRGFRFDHPADLGCQ